MPYLYNRKALTDPVYIYKYRAALYNNYTDYNLHLYYKGTVLHVYRLSTLISRQDLYSYTRDVHTISMTHL